MSWWARWKERQRQLELGVDADLVSAYRRKWRLSLWLFGSALFLFGVQSKILIEGTAHEIMGWLSIGCFLCASMVGYWARSEQDFLNKSDAEPPPSFWKWRR